MTTLSDRPGTALLVIDVQNGVMAEAFNRDTVIANIVSLVGKARAEQVPVLWVQHSDDANLPLSTPQWEYVPELPRGDGEPVVHKKYGDAFEATDLEERLAERGVGRLVVAGASSDACIRSTIHGAFTRGYDVTLHPGQRRAHHRRPEQVGRARPRPGDRPHESVLGLHERSRPHRGDLRHQGGELHRRLIRRTVGHEVSYRDRRDGLDTGSR
jgi:nicotinamidase-related amidase